MSISIVNGYVCTSSCDVAKAKKGEDPHPAEGPGEAPDKPGSGGPIGGTRRDEAVVFGGSLADPANPGAVKPVASADGTASSTFPAKNLVDLLA
jgi:hypothetical protein